MPLYKGDICEIWKRGKSSSAGKVVEPPTNLLQSNIPCRWHPVDSDQMRMFGLAIDREHGEIFFALDAITELEFDYYLYFTGDKQQGLWQVVQPVQKVYHPKGHWQAVVSRITVGIPASIRSAHGL